MSALELLFWLIIETSCRAQYELEREAFAPFVDIGGEA